MALNYTIEITACSCLPKTFWRQGSCAQLRARPGTEWALSNVHPVNKNRHTLPLSSERTTGNVPLGKGKKRRVMITERLWAPWARGPSLEVFYIYLSFPHWSSSSNQPLNAGSPGAQVWVTYSALAMLSFQTISHLILGLYRPPEYIINLQKPHLHSRSLPWTLDS